MKALAFLAIVLSAGCVDSAEKEYKEDHIHVIRVEGGSCVALYVGAGKPAMATVTCPMNEAPLGRALGKLLK